MKIAPLGLEAISCTSTRFCLAVGQRFGGGIYAVRFDGSSWSTPVTIDKKGMPLPSGSGMLSCASSHFCAAVTWHLQAPHDYVVRFNGTAWSAPLAVALGVPEAISCASNRFCINVLGDGRGDGYAVSYDGSSWSAPREITTSAELSLISCPTTSFCLAIADDEYLVGNLMKLQGPYTIAVDGSSWGVPIAAPDARGGLEALSCASSSFCVSVIGGTEYTYR